MGTISEKLTYLNGTKQLLKDKINNLGGSIDEQTTFRQYANQLQNVYDNLPKTEFQEGSNITLENTLKGKLDFEDDIVGYGDTKQKSTNGYNLLNSAGGSVAYKPEGTTITIDSNGVINASADMGYASINIPSITLKAGTTYTFKRNFTGSYNSYLVDTNNNNVLGIGYNKTSATATFETDTVINKLNGALLSGDNYFWLYEGTTSKDFEPYTNGASPNPSYPQEIEVVRGKNLFGDTLRQGVTNYITGTYNSNNTTRITTTNWLTLPKGTYTISAKNSANKLLQISNITFDTNGNYYEISGTTGQWKNMPFTITLPQDIKWQCNIGYSDGSDITPSEVSEFQIEEGSQATSYLPYNTIEVVERGKNLFNPDVTGLFKAWCNVTENNGEITITATKNGDIYIGNVIGAGNTYVAGNGKKIYVKPNTRYTITSTNNDVNKILFTQFDSNNISLGFAQANTLTTKANTSYIIIRYGLENAVNGTSYKTKIMVAEGTDTTYEPYQTPQTYQLSLGEYEFAKGNDNADEIIYDIENDKVYKNEKMNKKVLNGTEEWLGNNNWDNQYPEILHCYTTAFNDWFIGQTQYFCNKFICTTDANRDFTKEMMTCHRTSNVPYIFVFISRLNGVTINSTLEEKIIALKTWLSENKPEVWYQLNTPVLKDITGTLKDQIKALYNSHSFNGTTIITSNGNLPMIIKVRALKGE